jgi:acyl carrier protein
VSKPEKENSMTERERLVEYIHSIAPDFDPGADQLTDVLDSVSLLQLVVYIEFEFDVSLDLSNLTLDDFRSLDSVLKVIEAHRQAG